MSRLIISAFLTVDGVMEGPGRDEHRAGRNAWALRVTNDELERVNLDQLLAAGAILLGRRTYQIWSAFWPSAAAEQNMFAARMNSIRKYVVSNTLTEVDWNNTRLISGDVVGQIRELKREPGADLVCFGSADLAATLIHQDLADGYRFMVYPVILGSGKRMFRDDADMRHLRLREARMLSSGVVLLEYDRRANEPSSEYVEAYSWTEEQLKSLHAAQDTERVLATILFTDIVDSTGRAVELGDRAWRRLLDRHDEIARAEIGLWHGRLVKSTGDGVLATFDAPTRALRCAFGLREALAGLGLEIRAAIHTGEVEVREADVGGVGVHIASRALSEAGPGRVVVTRTVRDLATGTDLSFLPLGSVALRGVPGQWELFEAATR